MKPHKSSQYYIFRNTNYKYYDASWLGSKVKHSKLKGLGTISNELILRYDVKIQQLEINY